MTQAGAAEVLFEDDMESGTSDWLVDAPWALTTAPVHGGTQAWTDSPSGNYRNDQNTIIWSPVIDLTGVTSATLTFWHRYAFASGDRGHVWVAREKEDGWWSTEDHVRVFSDTQTGWQQTSIDLTPFVGEPVRLAFQLVSDRQRDRRRLDDRRRGRLLNRFRLPGDSGESAAGFLPEWYWRDLRLGVSHSRACH